ncbi:MAG: NUDIX domain-containing protein [Fibrobacterota bacterium]
MHKLFINTALGFLPILVFAAAEGFFGLEKAIIAAVVTGTAVFAAGYIKNHRPDFFVLFDTGLLMVFGAVSLTFESELFFRLKPAVIELIIMILGLLAGAGPEKFIRNLYLRFSGTAEADKKNVIKIRRFMLYAAFFTALHAALIVYTAVFSSMKVWAFVSGPLFYIAAGSVFSAIFLSRKINQYLLKKKYKDSEWFDIVNPEGKIKGKAPRDICHGNPDLLHRVVHMHIFNNDGMLLLQKRSPFKKIQPGKWDTAVGGHIGSGEEVQDALIREVKEEAGLSRIPHKFLFSYIMRNEIESEMVFTFAGYSDGPFNPDPEEVSDVRFFNRDSIKENLGKKFFTPNFEQEFGLLVKQGVIIA